MKLFFNFGAIAYANIQINIGGPDIHQLSYRARALQVMEWAGLLGKTGSIDEIERVTRTLKKIGHYK